MSFFNWGKRSKPADTHTHDVQQSRTPRTTMAPEKDSGPGRPQTPTLHVETKSAASGSRTVQAQTRSPDMKPKTPTSPVTKSTSISEKSPIQQRARAPPQKSPPVLADFLYLGSLADAELLAEKFPEVTDVISVNKQPSLASRVSSIIYHDALRVRAGEVAQLKRAADKMIKIIEKALERGGAATTMTGRRTKVFLHCDGTVAGSSASAALALAYVIAKNRTLRAALQHVIAAYPRACPEPAFLLWLKARECEMLNRSEADATSKSSVREDHLPELRLRMQQYVDVPRDEYKNKERRVQQALLNRGVGSATLGSRPLTIRKLEPRSLLGVQSARINGYIILGSDQEASIFGVRPEKLPPFSAAVGIGWAPMKEDQRKGIEYSKRVTLANTAHSELHGAIFTTSARISELYDKHPNTNILVYDHSDSGGALVFPVIVGWLMLHKRKLEEAMKYVCERYTTPHMSRDFLEQLQSFEFVIFKRATRLSYSYIRLPDDLAIRDGILTDVDYVNPLDAVPDDPVPGAHVRVRRVYNR